MLKVLQIVNRFNLGGPTYIAANLAKHLSPDFKTLLIGGSNDETEDSSVFIPKEMGIRPFIIPEMKRELNPKNDFIAYHKIKSIIKKFKPDIVHTHASKAGLLGRRAAQRLGVPVILHTFHGHVFHSYFGKSKSMTFQMVEKQLAKISNRIIAISESQKKELCDIYEIADEDKITVVPVGIDLEKFKINRQDKRQAFRQKYNLEKNEIAVGIIGRLVPVKNHELFLTAVKEISAKTTKKIRFFIIGDGEQREKLIEMAKGMNIDFSYNGQSTIRKSLLTFTSWIKDIDVAYAGLDVVALTSLNEGTPISLIEAQAANKPIVSTNVGGIRDIVIDGDTALLSKNGNPKDFIDNLHKVIEDDILRFALAKNGYDYVCKRFNYQTLAENMKKVYLNEYKLATS
ncbi:MAG: glycosyltransferase family 4 protein [Marinilabiliales bacterium]